MLKRNLFTAWNKFKLESRTFASVFNLMVDINKRNLRYFLALLVKLVVVISWPRGFTRVKKLLHLIIFYDIEGMLLRMHSYSHIIIIPLVHCIYLPCALVNVWIA